MFTRTAFALTFVLAAASGALAATKQSFEPRQGAYDARGTYVGSDPDANVRFELRRDSDRGN